MRVQQLQESGQDFRQARDIATREAMTRLEQAGVSNRFDREIALKSNQFNIEQNNLERRQIMQNQSELDKLGLQIRANNAQIPTQFAANVSNTVMQGVSAVYAQPMNADGRPTAAERQAQVQSLVNYANGQITWAEKFYGTKLTNLDGGAASREDIAGLYRSVLGREPDSGGLEHYVNSGMTVGELRTIFADSPEARNRR